MRNCSSALNLSVVCILTRNCTEGSGVCLDRMRDFFRFVNKWSSGDIGNIPLHPLPHYLSPSFLSVILTTSLPPSSSSLLISLLALLFLLPLSLLPLIPAHCLSPSFLSILLLTTSPPSFLSIHFITISLPPSSESSSPPPSSQSSSSLPLSPSSPSFSLPLSLLPLASSSLPLSFLPLNPPHYFSPSFLSILLTTSLPPSSQASSLPLSLLPPSHPHHLSILHSFQSATSLPLFSFL